MLTDTKARAARAKQKPYKLTDREGLYLFVTQAGAKSWRYDYRLLGARQTLTIGLYPDISLTKARDRLAEARRKVADGVSPADAKQAVKAEAKIARANTVRALGQTWYQEREKSRSRSWRDNATRFLEQDIYPAIGNTPIRDVTAEDVERLVRKVAEKRGAKSAHYMRLTLAGLFKSLPRSLNAGNPARDVGTVIELPKPKPKGRPLTPKEIPAFLEAADRYAGRPQTKLAIRLLMLTFTRKRELIEAPWEEIDFKGGQWVISTERMKMDKPHIIPLSSQAVECFKKLKQLAGDSPYVFPNIGDPKRPMSGSTLNKVFDEIGYGGRFTPHGARSTASTILNSQGWPGDAIERQLAHTERDLVRGAYNHSDFMEQREKMMQAWADYLDGIAAGAKVVNLRRAS
jgi:integrase